MNQNNDKPYDLADRTFLFAKDVRMFVKTLPKSQGNYLDGKQLLRSSGSVGANYIEANDALGKKDFVMHLRISRKECKESAYWLKLIRETNILQNDSTACELYSEAIVLKRILSSIINQHV